jgi:hypothetical protein
MIIACPSCHTRYRHGFGSGTAVVAVVAECSRCDEQFELPTARRTYILRGVDGGAAPASVEVPLAVASSPAPSRNMPESEDPVADGLYAQPPEPGIEGADASVAEPASEELQSATTARSSIVELLISILPSVAGAGLAYDLASRRNEDPITWAALGGAVGLLLGWACLLWISRKD